MPIFSKAGFLFGGLNRVYLVGHSMPTREPGGSFIPSWFQVHRNTTAFCQDAQLKKEGKIRRGFAVFAEIVDPILQIRASCRVDGPTRLRRSRGWVPRTLFSRLVESSAKRQFCNLKRVIHVDADRTPVIALLR